MELSNLKTLSSDELIEIHGGESLWDGVTKSIEDAGQYVGGFLYGLFVGDCPTDCEE